MKRLMFLTISVLLSTVAVAQFRIPLRKQSDSNSDSNSKKSDSNSDNSLTSFKDRIYFSMGGGAGGGTNSNGLKYNYFSILPTVGYRVTPEFLMGINFTYSKYSFPDYGISYEQVGYAPFARYYLQNLFFQAEYDLIKTPTYLNGSLETKKYYERFLVGVGYRQPLGKRGAVNAMAMYDLLYQPNTSPFLTPFVYRVFFSF